VILHGLLPLLESDDSDPGGRVPPTIDDAGGNTVATLSPTVGTSEDEDDSLETGSPSLPFDSGTSDVNRPTVGSVASGQDSHYRHHCAGNDDQSHHGQDASNNGFEHRDFVQHKSDYPLLLEDRPSLVIHTNELARVIEPVRSD
jgi:hypothetical protein